MFSKKTKTILAWSLYDFGNSAYAGLIPVLLFPLYYKLVILHTSLHADLWWGITAGVSILLAGIFAPFIGAMGDLFSKRKEAFVIASILAII